jgi:hypothetical protein
LFKEESCGSCFCKTFKINYIWTSYIDYYITVQLWLPYTQVYRRVHMILVGERVGACSVFERLYIISTHTTFYKNVISILQKITYSCWWASVHFSNLGTRGKFTVAAVIQAWFKGCGWVAARRVVSGVGDRWIPAR